MPDEKKIYLINIESNLNKYAEEAAEAKKKVDELKAANKELEKSGTASAAEIEANNAALRNAQKEYNQAKKMVDLQTAANKSEAGSRKQLGEILKLQEQELGKLGKAYITDAQGVRVLNPLYIEQRKRIKETNDAIIEYDKSLGDGRSSVGLYSEAIEGSAAKFAAIPGPIGQAGQAIARYSKILLTNPIVLVITAIVGAIAALVKAFKSSDKGGTEFVARFEQIKAIIDVVRQRLIAIANAITHVFKGEWKEAGQSMKEAFTGIGAAIKESTRAAYEYKKQLDILEDSENNYISRSAEMRNAIAKLEYTAQDRSKSTGERKKALMEATKLSEQETKEQRDFAKQKMEIEAQYLAEKNGLRTEDVIAFTKMTDAEQANANEALKTLRNNNEEKLIEIEKLYATWLDLDTKFFEENKRNLSRMTGFQETLDKELQALKDKNTKEIEELQKLVDSKILYSGKIEDIKHKELAYNAKIEKDNEAILRDGMAADALATETWIQNRDRAADALGALSNIIGKETEVGKVFAAAQATINTWTAASMTLRDPTIPSTFARIATMATVILTGLNTVRNIMKTSTAGSAPPTSAPTAIAAHVRSFATPVGASILSQPQLTQTQLNEMPSQNILTAEDIATALSKIPPPIVTVEDINARVKSVNKVSVRANI